MAAAGGAVPKAKFSWLTLFKKYFCEGQITSSTLQAKNGDLIIPKAAVPSSFVGRHRKFIAMFLPIALVHIIWWSYMISTDSFDAFTEADNTGKNGIPRWYMSITMVFGSMVAGATSEGGAAVAFPVMTLVFGIAPPVARDFSFMIQSVGMTCASFTILYMGVLIEWKAIIYTTIGGIVGIIFGLEYCQLTPPYAKMYFVVIWGAFAASLFYLNRVHGRKVYLVLDPPHLPAIWADATVWGPYSSVPGSWGSYVAFNWKAATLVATGFMGGIFSSISGSGIDICSFAILTLLFRISEKTATPTSVLLMSINTIVGFLFRQYGQGGVEPNAWGFLVVCAPIVCFGAPFGSVIGSFVHRLVLAWCIYITDAVQLIAAIVIVEPWVKNDAKPGKDTPVHLTASSIAIFCSGLVFFYVLQYLGEKLVLRNERIEAATLAFREAKLLSGHGLGMDRANELDAVKAPRKGAPAKSSAQPQEEDEEEGQQRPLEGVTGGAKSAGRADIEAPRVKSNPIAANAAGNLEGTL